MWRPILKIVMSFVIYNITVSVVNNLVNGAAFLLAKGGAPDLWRILHQHLAWKWIGVGFVAGFIPLQFLFSMFGFFRANLPSYFGGLALEKMKRWIVVLASPVAIVALLKWMEDWYAMRSQSSTALSRSSSMHLSRMFEGFFSTGCRDVSDLRLSLWVDNFTYQCALHVLQLTIFLSAAAYSVAPWVRGWLLNSFAADSSLRHGTREENEVKISTNGNDLNR